MAARSRLPSLRHAHAQQHGTGAWSSSTGGAGCVTGESAAWAQECWATTTAKYEDEVVWNK
jgi:hypothetical protein